MKTLLLAKSNLRKGRGLSIGVTALILTVALLLSATLIIIFDFLTDIDKQKEKLNAGDACVLVTRNIDNLDSSFFENALSDDVNDKSVTDGVGILYSMKYGSGTVSAFLFASSLDRLNKASVGKTEIVEEDKSIVDNYCYLPYQFHTGGGYNIGDNFVLKMPNADYNYRVKGFVNNFYLGSYNNGLVLLAIDETDLIKLESEYKENRTISANYDLKSEVDDVKFVNRLSL